jgi:hypothetical protein
LIPITLRDDQEAAAGGMDNLPGQIEEMMAKGFEGGAMVTRRQHQAFEPCHRLKAICPMSR